MSVPTAAFVVLALDSPTNRTASRHCKKWACPVLACRVRGADTRPEIIESNEEALLAGEPTDHRVGLSLQREHVGIVRHLQSREIGDAFGQDLPAVDAQIDLNLKNSKVAYGADRSMKMDFSEYDKIDDFELNEILWRAIKGKDAPLPPAVRRAIAYRIQPR